jgi:hypothetical protein
MLTKEQAINAREFHYEGRSKCSVSVGPRGGVTVNQIVARRNGVTQLWKTRPDDFSVPVKRGFCDTTRISEYDARYWHASDMCPLLLADIHLGTYSQRIVSYNEHMAAVAKHLEQCADCRDGKPQ